MVEYLEDVQLAAQIKGDIDNYFFYVPTKDEFGDIGQYGLDRFVNTLVNKVEALTSNKVLGVFYANLIDFASVLKLPVLQVICRDSYVFLLKLKDTTGVLKLHELRVQWLKTGIINMVTAYDTLRMSMGEQLAYKASEKYLPRLRGAIVDANYKQQYAEAILSELQE